MIYQMKQYNIEYIMIQYNIVTYETTVSRYDIKS